MKSDKATGREGEEEKRRKGEEGRATRRLGERAMKRRV